MLAVPVHSAVPAREIVSSMDSAYGSLISYDGRIIGPTAHAPR